MCASYGFELRVSTRDCVSKLGVSSRKLAALASSFGAWRKNQRGRRGPQRLRCLPRRAAAAASAAASAVAQPPCCSILLSIESRVKISRGRASSSRRQARKAGCYLNEELRSCPWVLKLMGDERRPGPSEPRAVSLTPRGTRCERTHSPGAGRDPARNRPRGRVAAWRSVTSLGRGLRFRAARIMAWRTSTRLPLGRRWRRCAANSVSGNCTSYSTHVHARPASPQAFRDANPPLRTRRAAAPRRRPPAPAPTPEPAPCRMTTIVAAGGRRRRPRRRRRARPRPT